MLYKYFIFMLTVVLIVLMCWLVVIVHKTNAVVKQYEKQIDNCIEQIDILVEKIKEEGEAKN